MLGEIVIVNASKTFPDVWSWHLIIEAIQTQLTRDVGPELGIIPTVLTLCTLGATIPAKSALITITDTPDEPDALGYHTEDSKGRPYGRVFVAPTINNGGTLQVGANSVSVTLSHEVIELCENPWTNLWADNLADGYQYSRERCDPVENDDGYAINGVSVSNFITKEWFNPAATTKEQFDFLGTLKAPFTLSTGGYCMRRAPGEQAGQIFGKEYPAWKAVLKSKFGRVASLK